MPIHQLNLRPRSKEEAPIDGPAVAEFLEGTRSLQAALCVTTEHVAQMKRQAVALFETKRWQRCADVLQGLAQIDEVGLEEVLMLIHCHRELGQMDEAELCEQARDLMLVEVERQLRAMEAEEDAE